MRIDTRRFKVFVSMGCFFLAAHLLSIGNLNAKEYGYDDGIEEIASQIEDNLKAKKIKGIAILDFQEINKKNLTLSKHLSEKLIFSMFKIKGLRVIERNKLNSVMEELKLQKTGLIDDKSIKELGKWLGVDALLLGSYTVMRDTVEINGRLVSTEDAEIISVMSVEFKKDGKMASLLRSGDEEIRVTTGTPEYTEPVGRTDGVINDPGTLDAIGAVVGNTYQIRTIGSTSGSVWGTNLYTTDSSIGKAAVHAGVLRAGQEGVVTVVVKGGLPNYIGSTRNGVTTSSWGSFGKSFSFVGAPAGNVTDTAAGGVIADPGTIYNLAGTPGRVIYVRLVGRNTNGSLWGTDIYTADSTLAMVAVHSGALRNGEEGTVKITILPGYGSYVGSTRNGVTSGSWGSYDRSFRIERAR